MLLYLLIQIPITIVTALTQFFPTVTALPFLLDSILTAGMNNFYYVALLVPPLYALWQAFLWVLGWKLALIVFRVIPVVNRMVP